MYQGKFGKTLSRTFAVSSTPTVLRSKKMCKVTCKVDNGMLKNMYRSRLKRFSVKGMKGLNC